MILIVLEGGGVIKPTHGRAFFTNCFYVNNKNYCGGRTHPLTGIGVVIIYNYFTGKLMEF